MLFLLLVLRLVLAILFAASAIAKLTSSNSFRATLREFGVPAASGRLLTWVIPVGELGVAVLLIPRSTALLGAALALIVLTIFSSAVLVMVASGRSTQCGCFGPLTGGVVGWRMLARNATLIAAAVLIVIGENDNAAVNAWSGAAASGNSLLAALAALAVSGVVLARSVSPLRAATYAAPTSVDSVEIGTRAPRFSVMSATGIPVTLEDLTSAGNPVLLVFTSPACRACREIEDRLIRQHESCGTLTLAIASRGTVHANAGLAERLGAPRVLLQYDHEVARAYGISRTPAAVLITAGGIVASAPAFDAAAIDALLDSAARHYMP